MEKSDEQLLFFERIANSFGKNAHKGGRKKHVLQGGVREKSTIKHEGGGGHKMPFFRARALCTAPREGGGVGPTVTSCVKDSLSLTRRDRDKGEGRKLQNFVLRK